MPALNLESRRVSNGSFPDSIASDAISASPLKLIAAFPEARERRTRGVRKPAGCANQLPKCSAFLAAQQIDDLREL
jgi:hypothetical protein